MIQRNGILKLWKVLILYAPRYDPFCRFLFRIVDRLCWRGVYILYMENRCGVL